MDPGLRRDDIAEGGGQGPYPPSSGGMGRGSWLSRARDGPDRAVAPRDGSGGWGMRKLFRVLAGIMVLAALGNIIGGTDTPATARGCP